MGRRGPKRTPTIILRNRGSWLAGQRRDADFPRGAPEPPDWLAGEARAAWDRLVPMLMERGVLTRADASALACLSIAWGRLAEAEAVIAREGLTVTTITGGVKQHPAVQISAAAWGQVVRGCALFGLDPADRSSVTGAGPPLRDDDALAEQGRLLWEQMKQAKGIHNDRRRA